MLTAVVGAIATVLAFLFYLGLKYARPRSGHAILRAITLVWAAIAVQQFVLLYYNIMISCKQIALTTHYLEVGIPVNIFLLIASIYYLWAAVRRNPPEQGGGGAVVRIVDAAQIPAKVIAEE